MLTFKTVSCWSYLNKQLQTIPFKKSIYENTKLEKSNNFERNWFFWLHISLIHRKFMRVKMLRNWKIKVQNDAISCNLNWVFSLFIWEHRSLRCSKTIKLNFSTCEIIKINFSDEDTQRSQLHTFIILRLLYIYSFPCRKCCFR